MNLSCPKCGSENTKKLSLVMSQGGVAEKGAQLGASYGFNIMLPAMTVVVGILLGIMFAMIHPLLGLVAFGGVLYGGYVLRNRLKEKTKSKYADLSPQMKQSGFQCDRCENLFIPV
jgi:hypothetical protein